MLNTVILMGRLVVDPELKHTPSDIAVTSFAIAVDRGYAKAGEERKTDFIDVVAWRGNAEFISKYFKKGQMIAIEGSLQTRTYQDKEGKNRKVFEVVANSAHFTGSKKESEFSDTYSEETKEQHKNENFSTFSNGQDDDFQTIESDEDLPF